MEAIPLGIRITRERPEADPDAEPLLLGRDGDDPVGQLAEGPFDRVVEQPLSPGQARVHGGEPVGGVQDTGVPRPQRRQPGQRPPFALCPWMMLNGPCSRMYRRTHRTAERSPG